MLAKHSRRNISSTGFILLFIALSALCFSFHSSPSKVRPQPDSAQTAALNDSKTALQQAKRGQTSQADARAACLDLPLSFESTDRENEFFGRGRGYSLLLSPAQFVLAGGR